MRVRRLRPDSFIHSKGPTLYLLDSYYVNFTFVEYTMRQFLREFVIFFFSYTFPYSRGNGYLVVYFEFVKVAASVCSIAVCIVEKEIQLLALSFVRSRDQARILSKGKLNVVA